MRSLLQGLCCTVATLFLFLCIGSTSTAATCYSVPSNTGFKAYMSYHAITNKKSKQWALQQRAHTDEDGIRVVDDRYCVAVGSYFNAPVGTPIDVHLDTGTVLKCIVGDRKADADTDAMHIQAPVNGNVVEFIVDSSKLSAEVRSRGTLSVDPYFEGVVTSIVVYSDYQPEITNTVKKVEAVETVSVDDIELTKINYQSDSDIDCVYTSIDAPEDTEDVFLTYTPIDGMVIGN